MRRRMGDVLAVVSLTLAIAAAGMAMRSAWWASDNAFSGTRGRSSVWLHSYGGGCRVEFYWPPDYSMLGVDQWYTSVPSWTWQIRPRVGWHLWNNGAFFGDAWMPYPTLIVLATAWPAIWGVMRLRERRRGEAGLCVACGYDLRGRRGDAAVCPECGAVPGAGAGASAGGGYTARFGTRPSRDAPR